MNAPAAVLGVLADLSAYTLAEPWETCLACGCLCKPDEVCPGCLDARNPRPVNTT